MSLRVAAYCRVSTDKDDQINSLESQKRYFHDYIRCQPGWKLVEVFADEGLSGTSSANRPAFQRMIAAAENGEIDLILTKEVSRFARNTVDTLAHTRWLSKRGVGVVFLGDNIDTRQNDGEFRLTIMASVAQEESRKTSERVKWGQRRSMENGVVFGGNNLYGYAVREGKLFVRPEQAEVVRLIYRKFLDEGKGTHVIARELYEAGISPPKAKGKPWSSVMVLRILRNEKYCGDLLQKKSLTLSFLDHKRVRNDGIEDKVYLRGHHEAIISRDAFDRAQAELARRAPNTAQRTRYSSRYWCSGKIVCGNCGARFVPRRRTRAGGFVYHCWVCHAKGQFGSPKGAGQGRMAGCDMRVLNHQTLCACMEYVVGLLGLDANRLTDEVLELLQGTGRLLEQGDLENLWEQQERTLQKKDAALDAYLERTISKAELERLRKRYDGELERLGKRLAALEEGRKTAHKCMDDGKEMSDFLRTGSLRAEAVFGELLDRCTVYEDCVTIGIHSLPSLFRLRFTTGGQAETYHTKITACDEIARGDDEPGPGGVDI